MTYEEELGSRLRELRYKADKSYKQVEKESGIYSPTLWKWENGRNIPNAYNIMLLSEYYHVSCDYIIKGKETK